METFRSRLEFLFGDVGPSKIAKSIGMAYAGFSRVWYEGSIPKVDTMVNIQKVTGCDLNWLLTGKGQPFPDRPAESAPAAVSAAATPEACDVFGHPVDVDEFAFIPRYNVKASAGHGAYNSDQKPTLTMAFRKYWIKNYLGAAPKDLSVIAVKGDSMEGVLNDGDNILVNHAKTAPADGLYVVRIGDSLVVKRTQLLPNDKLLVSSANDAYEPFTLDLKEPAGNIAIIGKVEWFGRQI